MFSVVQEKDRLCQWRIPGGGSSGRHRRAPGKPEQNVVPKKGGIMSMARAGDRFPVPVAEHHIFSVHTAVPSKGTADFFSERADERILEDPHIHRGTAKKPE